MRSFGKSERLPVGGHPRTRTRWGGDWMRRPCGPFSLLVQDREEQPATPRAWDHPRGEQLSSPGHRPGAVPDHWGALGFRTLQPLQGFDYPGGRDGAAKASVLGMVNGPPSKTKKGPWSHLFWKCWVKEVTVVSPSKGECTSHSPNFPSTWNHLSHLI